jgi:hypothetical protein
MIRLFTAVFDERISFNWDGESEKKAVSEAEAPAENNNNTKTAINPAMMPAEDARSEGVMFNKMSAFNASGSGSATV